MRAQQRLLTALRARLGALLFGLVLAAGPAEALPFVVNSTLDTADAGLNNVCDVGGGVCTLRAAIQESNFGGAGNTITFNLGAGPYSIAVGPAGLPAITRAVTINGYSQAGSAANTLPVGSNAVLLIELNGTATGAGVNGLTIAAPTTVRGLVINRFAGHGIQVSVGGATSVIAGNYVGTNVAGSAALGNNRDTVGSEAGIELFVGGVTIGGTAPADRNLVSGNSAGGARGIELWDSSGNTIQGNYIGTNAAGTLPLGNGGAGIAVDGTAGVGSDNNLIGGVVAGAGNLCSGGLAEGVAVYVGSTGNAVLGNRIYGNGTGGIDLGGDGVTANDALDGDGGPNNQLNFPVIGGISVVGASLVVNFSLDVPAGSYRVEFFRNPSGVDVPNGEGEVFAGFQNVTHGGGGSRSFSATFAGVSGDRITAATTLCTDGGVCAAFSDTSEFSANLIAVPTNYRSIGTAPNDSTGSVNTTNTSQVVAGVGTSWLTINRGRGDVISICDQVFPTCTTSTNYTVLRVGSNTQLTLTTPYAGTTGNHGYTIRRQFTTLTAWEDCVDGPGGVACPFFPVASASLVADNRSEVGIAYDDAVGTDFVGGLDVNDSTTDANHTITLTADGDNRHYGLPGQGVLVNNGASVNPAVLVQDDFVTVEWLEITGGGGSADGIRTNLLSAGAGSLVTLRNNLIHNVPGDGFALFGADGRVDVYDNISYGNNTGLYIDSGTLAAGSRIRILNNTFYGNGGGVFKAGGASAATVLLRNNISFFNNPAPDYICDPADSVDPASGNNLDEDNSGGTGAGTHNPAGGRVTSTLVALAFVNAAGGDFHIQPGSTARDVGADLSSVFTSDIDTSLRQSPWDIGADEIVGTALYRSVGITAGALASGAGNALTISGSTASFASPLPNNIGVGDAIQYDSDNNGSIDALAFIHRRTSSQAFTVKSRTGAAPSATGTPDTDWAVYRAYTSLANWEAQNENGNISNAPVPLRDFDSSTNLVNLNTTMNVACYGDGADTTLVTVGPGWITGLDNYIRIYTPYAALEVGTSQRHSGTWNATTAYRLQAAPPINSGTLWIQTNYVRVDGLQVWQTNDVDYTAGIYMYGAVGVSAYEISNNVVRGVGGVPTKPGRIGINDFDAGTAGSVAKIWNNLVYDFNGGQLNVAGILLDDPDFTHYVYNNTVVDGGQGIAQYNGIVVAKNNLAYNNLDNYNGAFGAASTNNLSGPAADVQIPTTNKRDGVTVTFVNAAADDFHLAGGDLGALNQGTNLSADPNLAIFIDIDHQSRVPAWDIGADDASGTTAVRLTSFSASGADGAVDVSWATGSEVDNLGFHVWRGPSESGPWTRLTPSLVPGLGFSPMGGSYAWRDSGLQNGTRYYYRLEDVDSRSVSTFHGPVAAVPQAGATPPVPPSEGGGSGSSGGTGSGGGSASPTCPSWALAQLGSSASYTCEAHGDPAAASFRVLSRTPRSVLVELDTEGFLTARDATGRVRALIPGFDSLSDPLAPALPLKRARLDGVVGRQARIGSIQARENRFFTGLVAAAVGYPQAVVAPDGTVQPGRREAELLLSRGVFPRVQACLVGEGFQGEDKTLALELMPLRYDASRGALVLSRRLTVRVDFAGAEPSEIGRGRLGRHIPRPRPDSNAYAFLGTSQKGLHSVAFETLFPGRSRPLDLASLRLTRGASVGSPLSAGSGSSTGQERVLVPFFVLPQASTFGPGSRLFFHVDTTASSTSFSAETVYALERGAGGVQMALGDALPDGPAGVSSRGFASFETNRIYAPDVLDIEDLWQWESLGSGVSKTKPFALDGLDSSSPETARLVVFLQGGSDAVSVVDHHVQVFVKDVLVAEESFDGAVPHRVETDVPVSLLQETGNELRVLNVGDTGVASRVFLDRFEVLYPQVAAARSGAFDGTFSATGTADIAGIASPAALLDVTDGASWLTGYETGPSLRFHAETGRRYLAVSQEALLSPRVFFPEPTARLRSLQNQADYVLVAPRAFLDAAEPLLERRESQGLSTFAASLEEIASSFGGGQASAEAIRDFLSFAYHQWRRPSPRYVLLLGDANYDPRRFNPVSQPSPMPFLLQRTSYIWTASDPALVALNGDDPLPDLAIGRLPADHGGAGPDDGRQDPRLGGPGPEPRRHRRPRRRQPRPRR